MVEVQINLPQYPEGTEIAITGLGRFPNGGDAVEVDEDSVAIFEEQQQTTVQEALKNNPGVSVDGTEGQTVEQPSEDNGEGEPETPPEEPQAPQATPENTPQTNEPPAGNPEGGVS